MNDVFDIEAWKAEFLASIPTDREPRVYRPLTTTPGFTDAGHAGLHVDGDCPERCHGGFTFGFDLQGYERSYPCPNCTPAYQHARRFNAAMLPVWAHRVRRDWSGERTWPQVETVAKAIRTGNDNARVYFGDPGRGKSFLACAIALECIAAGMSTRWVTWPDLLSSLKDQMRDDKPLRQIIEPINRAELLVVDEVKGIATPFSSEVAELLIGRRAELGRKVVITGNLDEPQLWAYLGDRVRSRLTQAGKTLEITGDDRRAQEAA